MRYAALFFLVVLVGCRATLPNGSIEGQVVIGPLCPVEPCEVEAKYDAYSAYAYDIASRTLANYGSLDATGRFSLEVSRGTYFVVVAPGHEFIDYDTAMTPHLGWSEPRQVIVSPDRQAPIVISLDTGIR